MQKRQKLSAVNKVVKEEVLMDKALEIARIIASKGPVALKLAKKLINENQEIKEGLEREIVSFSECLIPGIIAKAINAFLEKRKSMFKGI